MPDRFEDEAMPSGLRARDGWAERPARHRRRSGAIYIVGIVLVLATALGWFALRTHRSAALTEARQERSQTLAEGPLVQTAMVACGSGIHEVTLLGDARPFQAATLYAKVSGYLDRIAVDKGDHVKEGDVIAQISSPELDQQYAGALADLQNKQRILRRAQLLIRNRDVPQQTVDNAMRDVTVAEATARQLATLKGYQTVRAPFAGVVTARFADPGALVQNAETNQQNALGLVTLVDDSRLRIYVHVPQTEAPFVRAGQKAVVADAANPNLKTEAEVTRTAGALDTETRTLLTEVDLTRPAPGAEKPYFPLPGSFVYVTLDIPVEALPEIPANALLLRGGEQKVAAIAPDNRVHFIPVRVVQTDGRTVRIEGDVKPGQRLAANLPVSVADGDLVQPAPAETAAASGK